MIGSRHLGARVSDFLDDRLVGEERERTREHLTTCEACQTLVTQHRQQRRAAAALACVDVPDGLQQRLLALAEAAGTTDDDAPWSGSASGTGQRGRLVVVAAASVAGLGVAAAGGLFALGQPQPWTTDTFADVAALGGDAAAAAAPGEATSAVWPSSVSAPLTLPASSGVTQSHELPTGAVRVDVVVGGVPVVVVEGPGRLALEGRAPEHVLPDGVEVHELEGWWAVQTGLEVIACSGEAEACLAVLQAFEGHGFAVGITERIGAGWRAVTGG